MQSVCFWLGAAIFTAMAAVVPVAQAGEDFWRAYGIGLENLSEQQVLIIEDTLTLLKSLEPGEIRINEKVYRRLSRFETLFGTPFKGEALLDWVLSRMRVISYGESWTVAVNRKKGEFRIGDAFFNQLTPLQRLYLLVHEARHSDGNGYPHVRCPKGFKFVSAAQPELNLEHEKACDDNDRGAYAFQAAFLFELYAYGFFDQTEAGLLYNGSISRIIP